MTVKSSDLPTKKQTLWCSRHREKGVLQLFTLSPFFGPFQLGHKSTPIVAGEESVTSLYLIYRPERGLN